MKNVLMIFIGVLLVVSIGACSNGESRSAVVADQIEADTQQAEFAKKKLEAKQEAAEKVLDEVPEWVLDPPKTNATGMYAVGIGKSSDLSASISVSKLKAQFELAQLFKQELSGGERSFVRDNGDDNVSIQYTMLIDRIVNRVPLRGFKIIKQKVKVIGAKYNSFVLMQLPFDEINKVINQQRIKSKDETIRKAFEDLEYRLDKHRQQSKAVKSVGDANVISNDNQTQAMTKSGSAPKPDVKVKDLGEGEF